MFHLERFPSEGHIGYMYIGVREGVCKINGRGGGMIMLGGFPKRL